MQKQTQNKKFNYKRRLISQDILKQTIEKSTKLKKNQFIN